LTTVNAPAPGKVIVKVIVSFETSERVAHRMTAKSQRSQPRSQPDASGAEADLRCGCGSLLAKLVSGAVELKCRRCKQTWRVPLQAD
jgi:hypothetical protein